MLPLDRQQVFGIMVGAATGYVFWKIQRKMTQQLDEAAESYFPGQLISFVSAWTFLKAEGRETTGWPRLGITAVIMVTAAGTVLTAFRDPQNCAVLSSLATASIVGKRIGAASINYLQGRRPDFV